MSRCAFSTWRPHAVVISVVLFFVLPCHALAADVVTLRANPKTVRYGARISLKGAVSPVVAGETVAIYARRAGREWSLLRNTATDGLGRFSLRTIVKAHETVIARATDAAGDPVESAPVSVRVCPRIVTHLRGSRSLAARLYIVGRVLPRASGIVMLTEGDRVQRVPVGPRGHFYVQLTTTRLVRYRAIVDLRPAPGYVGWHRTYSVRVKLRPLTIGSRGPAVNWLEYSLSRLHRYALLGVDNVYDYVTTDAVLAFQKVHGLPLTGSVDRRFWQILSTSGPPAARIPSGDHIEVDKTRQLLFEVRQGEVVSVSRVSTGATGNTPVGHWHVYAKGQGFNAKGMYDSLFFVGEFAIHGYYSVPSYPASHGCVRTPIWFASGLYSRWGVGTSVYVFP